jgi:NADPH:quinone reductase-like Zn-dependent oxidoreductase
MPEQTMKAMRIHGFGGPEVLSHDDVPVPAPGPGEVLVRVAAVAVNPPDWYAREGFPGVPREMVPPMELPMVLGTDVSGVVQDVGAGVEGFAAGDEVFGLLRFPATFQSGAYAEYVTAPVEDLAHKPAGISHADAAGLAMAGLTAWQFLIELGHDHPSPFQEAQHRPVPITPGMTVLVNGAAGGVGHLALQLAKWRGARVIAVASGSHESFLRELGADEFIDYTKAHPEELVRDVDLVLDTVGGAQSHRFLRVLKRGGALFPVYMAQYDPEEVERLGITTTSTQVRANGRQLAQLGELVEAGALRLAVDSTYPLAQARQAHERAARGHLQGKLILTVA